MSSDSPSDSKPNSLFSLRNIFGAVAIALYGVSLYRVFTNGTAVINDNPYIAGALRGGILLGALWLAWPDIQSTKRELPYPMIAAMAIMVGVMIIGPQHLLMFASFAVALIIFFAFNANVANAN